MKDLNVFSLECFVDAINHSFRLFLKMNEIETFQYRKKLWFFHFIFTFIWKVLRDLLYLHECRIKFWRQFQNHWIPLCIDWIRRWKSRYLQLTH